ncbi:MAG: TolB family protein [Planctomycetota bacterium]
MIQPFLRAAAFGALISFVAVPLTGCPAKGPAAEAQAQAPAGTPGEAAPKAPAKPDTAPEGTPAETPNEPRLKNIRQLTNGGENAEAYLSFDEKMLAFQSTRPPYECDQIFVMGIDGKDPTLVSTGTGRTTCAYYMPDGKSVLFASTHLGGEACPEKPDHSQGYVWPLYPSFDIFVRNLETQELTQLTSAPGYDAEATVSPTGDRIVFTSTRNGDIDLYSMKLDGTDVQQLTDELGYDGGAFYSYDGKKIVYRTMQPDTPEAIADYKRLLGQGLVRPSKLEIWVMDADGSNKKQVTELGKASFAPFFHPDGKRIIFSSNVNAPRGRDFDLYMINVDGTGLEQITFNPTFDGFPFFSRDGKTLIFGSNRDNAKRGETNVFVADWVD